MVEKSSTTNIFILRSISAIRLLAVLIHMPQGA
jgi:hypothetical protein